MTPGPTFSPSLSLSTKNTQKINPTQSGQPARSRTMAMAGRLVGRADLAEKEEVHLKSATSTYFCNTFVRESRTTGKVASEVVVNLRFATS